MRSPRFTIYALLLILFLAATLRFFRISYQSYWNDEGNSRVLAGSSAPTILASAAADIHPPGYYLALAGWRALVGESELALRGFSALAGVVLIALLYRLGREYFDTRSALAAALLGAVNPFLIYYSQEARMYELLATLSAASFLLFSLWLKSSRPPEKAIGDWRLGLGYVLASAAGLYTHYAFPFVLIAQNLAALGGLLFHRRGQGWKRLAVWFGLQCFTLLLFTFWLPIAYRQLTTWPAAREFQPFLSALADVGRYLALGRTIPTAHALWAISLVGLSLIFSFAYRGQTITPLLWLLAPVGLTLGFGLLSESFSKFLLVAVPPFCLLLGNGLIGGRNKEAGGRLLRFRLYALRFATLLVLMPALYASLSNLYFNPQYFRDDYRGIARYIESLARPNDAIITISPNQVQAFEYYHRPEAGGAEVFPLPHTRPPDKVETEQALQAIAATHARIFVLFWGEGQADPEGIVENWLNTHAFKAGDAWYGQVRLATYAVSEPASEIAVPSNARFGDNIQLKGYTLQSQTRAPGDTMAPGDIVQVTLFWQTDTVLKERYKIFVHVSAGLDVPPIAQQDGEPGGGQLLTSAWPSNTLIADNHGILLPPDLPPGEYTLFIGLYNLFDSTRLPITINAVPIGDRLELTTITIR